MNTLIVGNCTTDSPPPPAFSDMLCADDYLTDACWPSDACVINLCAPLDYQSVGYYVSLLAQARGHRALPSVKTIEDVHAGALAHLLMAHLDAHIQTALGAVDADRLAMTLCIDHDLDGIAPALARHIFALLPAPLLKIEFFRDPRQTQRWQVAEVALLTLRDLDARRLANAAEALHAYLLRWQPPLSPAADGNPTPHKPSVAILYDPARDEPPSNGSAIDKFQQAATALGMQAEIITRDDSHRLAQFDALFIRDTTSVNHYTYQLSRLAAVEGLVVMDDPDSILQCTNKVYLNELLQRHHLPVPKTLVVHRNNIDQVIPTLGLPCILKQPDGAFSLGVVKITSERQLAEVASWFLQDSALILAQQYLPTAFDWRIGILDRRALFACKYYMAPGHWQIIKRRQDVKLSEGRAAAVPLAQVPAFVIDTALAAANLIGDGFYGVDLKQIGQRCVIIEINDNPNVDMGNEDGVLHDGLYREVMQVFRKRIGNRQLGGAR